MISLLAHFVQKDTQRDQCLDVDRKADAVKAIAMQGGFLTDEVSPLYKAYLVKSMYFFFQDNPKVLEVIANRSRKGIHSYV